MHYEIALLAGRSCSDSCTCSDHRILVFGKVWTTLRRNCGTSPHSTIGEFKVGFRGRFGRGFGRGFRFSKMKSALVDLGWISAGQAATFGKVSRTLKYAQRDLHAVLFTVRRDLVLVYCL